MFGFETSCHIPAKASAVGRHDPVDLECLTFMTDKYDHLAGQVQEVRKMLTNSGSWGTGTTGYNSSWGLGILLVMLIVLLYLALT